MNIVANLMRYLSFMKGSNASANSTVNSTVDPAVANASSKVLDTVMKVGGSLMRQLVAGDKPTKVSLPNMDVEMSQVGEDADEDATGFRLPSMASLLGNQTSDGTKKSVGAMVSLLKYHLCCKPHAYVKLFQEKPKCHMVVPKFFIEYFVFYDLLLKASSICYSPFLSYMSTILISILETGT